MRNVSRGTNLTVLELKFSFSSARPSYPHQSCFDIADIITNSVFIIVKVVVNVSLAAHGVVLVSPAQQTFPSLIVCFPFPVRPCLLLECSPTKPPVTHTSYNGLACKIVHSFQIPKKARVKTSVVSSLKSKESTTARDLRKLNALSIKQLCLK